MAEIREDIHPKAAPARTELVWPGKHTQVERVALPFQVVETINQSRAHQRALTAADANQAPDQWTNKLIWGENKYVMASLLNGDPSVGLEPLAGKVDLIYIDPPFATGQDFTYRVKIGDEEWVKEASIIEETAYRDTWGRGLESYLQMMYERLVLMRELLAEHGSIYVHCDYRIDSHLRLLLDELFGSDNLVNEIVWKSTNNPKGSQFKANKFGINTNTILLYSKAKDSLLKVDEAKTLMTREEIAKKFPKRDENGPYYEGPIVSAPSMGARPNLVYEYKGFTPRASGWRLKREKLINLDKQGDLGWSSTGNPFRKLRPSQSESFPIYTLWDDIKRVYSGEEKEEYVSQKPEALLDRMIKASSNPGDLVADFFSGSGTTAAVAEKLGRRWIGCDLSRYAIQVSRKRLLDIPGCKPFQVLNLGKYERKHWQVNVLNGRQGSPQKAVTDYYRFILALYHAEPIGGYTHLHGQKAGRWVHVGPVDAPVTRA